MLVECFAEGEVLCIRQGCWAMVRVCEERGEGHVMGESVSSELSLEGPVGLALLGVREPEVGE